MAPKRDAFVPGEVENAEFFNVGPAAFGTTETNIPFMDGLYRQSYAYPPETILSHTFFMRNMEEFFRFYREKMLFLNAEPNAAHIAAAKLEQQGKLRAVVTQNIDGLHQAAGSKTVYELHGSVHRNFCMECGRFYPVEAVVNSTGIPRCDCGGVIKPDVVLYEESLDSDTLEKSVDAIQNAEVLIVGGTSLSVYPAAGLIRYFRGNQLVLINKTPTPYDREADLVISGSIGEVMGSLVL